jgi:RNA polymerase sigma-70 factor (ECF subfamily)
LTAPSPDEGALVAACQRGDREAFRQLFELYRTQVHRVALHLAGSEAAAKDITQQVFLQVWRQIGRFRGDALFSTWLYRLAINATHDERRRQRRIEQALPLPEPATCPTPDEIVLLREVQAALLRLRPKLRIPIVLRHLEGLSYQEIARVLGCSAGTVASRLSRGSAQLAHELERGET